MSYCQEGQHVHGVIQTPATSHFASLKQRVWIEEDRLDAGDGQHWTQTASSGLRHLDGEV